MKRRNFLTNTTLAAAGIAGIFTARGSVAGSPSDRGAVPAASGDLYDPSPFSLEEISVTELQAGLSSGKYTSAQLVAAYFKRMDEVDAAGPKLGAVIERNPDALKIAASLDAERKNGKTRGPLHGVPILIKDNIDTNDQMQTTAGALALAGNKAAKDAFIVQRLREAGAILMGKTNLSEWANFRSTHSCSGWSSRGGQTKNPYFIDHNPCGSSSGSGVAVSANLCTVAIGTETDGSVTCPASVNGIVGLKPTVGLVSRSGIIPISSTQDTAGPMARTVRDVAILLGVLTGVDSSDAVTTESKGHIAPDYTIFLHKDALTGKRIGVEKNPPGSNPAMLVLQQASLEVLRQQGATIIGIEFVEAIGKLGDAEFELMQYEFKDGVNKYLASSRAGVKTLAEVIAWNNAHASTAMPYFRQETLESSDKKEGLDSGAYKAAREKSFIGTRKILDDLVTDHQLDAIAGLTMGPACSIDTIYGDRWGDHFLTQPAAASGYPHISVPGGMIYGLPVGFSFFGPAYSEGTLLGLAFAYEQATKHRVKPGLKSSFI